MVPIAIMNALIVVVMSRTVAFNYQSFFVTIKIYNIRTELMLPPKLKTKQAASTQQLPKEFLRPSLRLAKLTRES